VNPVERYVKLLKNKNLKITHHRLEILAYLDTHHNHPTAEDIFQHLKKKNPGLSRTTVYNNLDTLTQSHIIQRLTICPTEHRYDFNQGSHHHFICKECGAIYDINVACPIEGKIRSYLADNGHKINEVHGYFKGICKECIKKNGDERQ
jgi:Fe2+ or Zn2+ uptake regulation protein